MEGREGELLRKSELKGEGEVGRIGRGLGLVISV